MSAALDDALRMLREARARADAAEGHICAADLAVEAAEARLATAETEAASLRERVKALEDQMRAICSEFAQGHPLIAAGRRLLGMDRLVRAEFKTFDEWAAEARATLEEKPHD